MLVALLQGYEATDKDIHELLISMKASRWRIFFLARLPSALPYFFAGLRIAITYAVVGAIFAEYAGAAKGLGIYILNAKNNFRPDLVLAAVFVSAGLTLVLLRSRFCSAIWRCPGAIPKGRHRHDLTSNDLAGNDYAQIGIPRGLQILRRNDRRWTTSRSPSTTANSSPSSAPPVLGKSTILRLLTGTEKGGRWRHLLRSQAAFRKCGQLRLHAAARRVDALESHH